MGTAKYPQRLWAEKVLGFKPSMLFLVSEASMQISPSLRDRRGQAQLETQQHLEDNAGSKQRQQRLLRL